MKYIKGTQEFRLDDKDCTYTKIRLNAGDGGETPWAFRSNLTGELFSANHILHLMPFESWGCKMPKSNMNKEAIDKLMEERELHPDAWKTYIDNNIIDDKGNYIAEEDRIVSTI